MSATTVEYSQSSTVHGIQYIFESGTNLLISRILWFIIVVIFVQMHFSVGGDSCMCGQHGTEYVANGVAPSAQVLRLAGSSESTAVNVSGIINADDAPSKVHLSTRIKMSVHMYISARTEVSPCSGL